MLLWMPFFSFPLFFLYTTYIFIHYSQSVASEIGSDGGKNAVIFRHVLFQSLGVDSFSAISKHCCHFLILSSNGFYARATLSIQNNLEHWCEDDRTRVAVRVACFEMHVFVSIVSFTYGANVNTIDRFFFFCSRKWCHAQCHAHTD